MLLEVDNKGTAGFCYNWSVTDPTRHIEVKQYILCDLNKAGLLNAKWKSDDAITSDLFTTNLICLLFENMVANSMERMSTIYNN